MDIASKIIYNMFKRSICFLFLVGCVLIFCEACRISRNRVVGSDEATTERLADTEDLLLAKSAKGDDGIILRRIAYITSYNRNTKNPNWVAWHLTREHANGDYPRKGAPYYDENGKAIGIEPFSPEIVCGDYFVDMQVPASRQEHSDWRERPRGMDHGHMCPAADCKWDKGAMNQSFLLTNMCPQNHGLNGGDWDYLENRCRSWAKKYVDIYIVAGPIFYDEVKASFGKNKIAIPDAFFKVVLCLHGTPKALGFIFQNEDARHDIDYYLVTVDEVEKITGLDFFSSLEDSVENAVESTSDLSLWR